jgi:hypothetical protein
MKKSLKLALCGILLLSIGFGVDIYVRRLTNNKIISKAKAKQIILQEKISLEVTKASDIKKKNETKAQQALAHQALVKKKAHQNVNMSTFNYNTGITFDQLAGLPDKFIGCGFQIDDTYVLAISRNGKMLTLKLAIDSDIIDKYLLVICKASIAPSNISNGDQINIKGISMGHVNYADESSGSVMNLPEVSADKITEYN